MWTANTEKCCAKCANWGGQRTIKFGGSTIETNQPGDRGECYAGVFCSATPGPCACDGVYCDKFTKLGSK